MRFAIGKQCAASIALAAAVVLGTAPEADAGFQVTFGANGSTKTIVDGGAGDFDGVADNSITVISETVGSYTFSLTLTTTNTPGIGGIAFVNQGTNMISGTGATTVTILAEASGFSVPSSPPDVTALSGSTFQILSGTTGTNPSADHSYTATIDYSNSVTGTLSGTTIGSGGPATVTGVTKNSDLTDAQTFTVASTPYALNLLLSAKLKNTGTNVIDLDGTLQLQPVPEPASLAAAFTALPLLGGLYLRRRARRTA